MNLKNLKMRARHTFLDIEVPEGFIWIAAGVVLALGPQFTMAVAIAFCFWKGIVCIFHDPIKADMIKAERISEREIAEYGDDSGTPA